MTDYTKATNFAAKDALITGDPAKVVRGTELNVEFTAIATAIATKYDSATLGASSGSSLSGFIQSGANSVATTAQAKMRERISVLDKGGVSGSDLTAALNAAITDLPSTGGIIDCTMLQGAQIVAGKVSINKAGVTILFGSATYTLSGIGATQSPFGANFLVTVADAWLVGNYTTKFFMDAGAEADAVAFIHGSTLGGVIGIEIDGNKANNSANGAPGLSDDTFQSAVQIICNAAGGSTVQSRITIKGCKFHDHIHYGIVLYGDLSGGNLIEGNLIYSNGKASDADSTGDGIYVNQGSGNNTIRGNHCYSNNRSGIRLSTAGVAQSGNKVLDNWCYSNTGQGITADEESATGSISGVGQSHLSIRGNHCYSNTGHGIRLGAYDSVGFIANPTVEANHCYDNTGYGIVVQSSAHASNNVRQAILHLNQCTSNGIDGIAVGANVLDTTISTNTCLSNVGNQILDLGTRSLNIANKDTITAPVWYEQGTWTPIDSSGAGLALTVAAATYVKIGKMVYATFAITYPATASGASSKIGGMPYASQNSAAAMHPVSISFANAGAALGGIVDANATTFSFVAPSGGAAITNANLSTIIVRGTAIYEVA